MLQNISWPTYFTWCFIALLLYYITIGLLYFRYELVTILKQPGAFKKFNNAEHSIDTADNDIPALVSVLKDELIAFAEATGSGHERTEVLLGLQKIISKYSVLKDSAYKNEINSTIAMSCENNCAIALDEEDMAFLWNG
ncbi:hypothetical protein [Ferruginibacter sp.]